MFRIGLRRDAVAEIEDQGTVSEHLQDGVDPFVERSAAGDHAHRIEIALHRPVLLQFGREGQRHRPVETDRIRLRLLPVGLEPKAGSLAKGDACGALLHLIHQLFPSRKRPRILHRRNGNAL